MPILGNAEDVSADGISNLSDEDSNEVKKSSCSCSWNSTDGEVSSCSCDGNQTDRFLVRCTVCGRNKLDQEMAFCTCDGNQHDGVFDSEQNASPESQPADVKDRRNISPWAKAALGVGIALVGIPTAIPMVVTVAGFGAGGPLAGSMAASFMASYGGAVAPGSLCAVLQSIGATGAITGGTTMSSLGVGFTVTGLASTLRAKVGGKAK